MLDSDKNISKWKKRKKKPKLHLLTNGIYNFVYMYEL